MKLPLTNRQSGIFVLFLAVFVALGTWAFFVYLENERQSQNKLLEKYEDQRIVSIYRPDTGSLVIVFEDADRLTIRAGRISIEE